MGFEDDARNLLLLTRECVGNYKLMELEDSLVYADGTEGSEEDRKEFRPWVKRRGVLKVDKNSAKKWRIGGLNRFCTAGCLGFVYMDEDEDKGTDQHWIEGNNLVTHGFMEETDCEDHEEEKAQDDSDVKEGDIGEEGDDIDKERFGVEHRAVISFYKDKFIYKENTMIRCETFSYEYKIEASFAKL